MPLDRLVTRLGQWRKAAGRDALEINALLGVQVQFLLQHQPRLEHYIGLGRAAHS